MAVPQKAAIISVCNCMMRTLKMNAMNGQSLSNNMTSHIASP